MLEDVTRIAESEGSGPMARQELHWNSDWALNFRCWLERDGKSVLGSGRAELLTAIDRDHSISAAARNVGMSYRHAWLLVQEINQAAGMTLVEAAVGGEHGGGARLTAAGKQALSVFEALQTELTPTVSQALGRRLNRPTSSDCLHLVAAVSLQEVIGQLLAAYGHDSPTVQVRAVYGASNELADHLLRGMEADLFLSADKCELERLQAAGLVSPRSRQFLARNTLAAVAVERPPVTVRKPADLLKPEIQRIALAEPECPLGKCSHAYLHALGIYEQLCPKLLHVDTPRGVLAALRSDQASIGLAFGSEAATSESCRLLFRASQAEGAAEYFGAVLRSSCRGDSALNLLKFFRSRQSRARFAKCGFAVGRANASGK